MRDRTRGDGLVKWFCDRMGRRHALADFLDRVARWLLPPPPQLAAGGVGALPAAGASVEAPAPDVTEPLVVRYDDDGSKGWAKREHRRGDANPGGKGPKAPTYPWFNHGYVDPADPPPFDVADSKKQCRFYRLTGMHGRPCRSIPHAGGSDTKCPTGTVGGWFWKYDVPAYGTVFYVDCCGKSIAGGVWCNWSKEANWCVTGKAASTPGLEMDGTTPLYTCTLALLASEIKWGTDPSGGTFVDGVD
jgi:hypothetical protein